ncbi:conserved hypothetical protein [Candida albicans WO-1]|uniref:Uncharacterized protein n=2 Tax=Candida albicans TaxID=5476 RepID=Q5APB8_CANAL|nr:uncharacterized protein CAALFM_C109820CA [Candida albicans SC5314]AOW26614.1 hypothetical protein CAALFM_C109820CA [Candida albicans SC5314]EEQ42245.1 conserved hypothetical protein [Candida albicans WO-1]|eukprot:XP_723533.1 hypothetical protein CAALFM_C109820CA [Candida albicans SC5314]
MNARTTLPSISSSQSCNGGKSGIKSKASPINFLLATYPPNCCLIVSNVDDFVPICLSTTDPHLSFKFPNIHWKISSCNHSISCNGSYPLVALPSASVVPSASTICIKQSASVKSLKNLFPNPSPKWAFGTNPATSNNIIGTPLFPLRQYP